MDIAIEYEEPIEGLIIHRRFNVNGAIPYYPEDERTAWLLTHKDSGRSLAGIEGPKERVEQFCERLDDELDVDWTVSMQLLNEQPRVKEGVQSIIDDLVEEGVVKDRSEISA